MHAGGHDFVEDEEGTSLGRCRAQAGEEGWLCRDGAAGAEHGFDEDGGDILGVGFELGVHGGEVVVLGDQVSETARDESARITQGCQISLIIDHSI